MEQALAELASEETATRLLGVRRLGVSEGPEAVEMLIHLMDDPNMEVACRAALTLGDRELPEIREVLLDRFRSHPSGEVRESCGTALLDARVPVDVAIDALSDPVDSVTEVAAYILGDLGDPVAIEPLLGVLDHPRWSLRYAVCRSLVDLGANDPKLVCVLRQLLSDPEQSGPFQPLDWIEEALAGLTGGPAGEAAEPSEADLLARAELMLREGDPAQRKKAAYEIHRIERLDSAPSVIEALVHALDDPAPSVRSTAALVLGSRAVPSALPGLIHHLLYDESSHVRRMCSAFMHYFPAAEAVDPLIRALPDPDWGVRLSACVGLGLLGDPRASPVLFPLLEDPDWNNRTNAAWALVRLGTSDSRLVTALEQLARDPEAVEWDLQADEMNQQMKRHPPEEIGEDEVTPSPKIHELLAEARRLCPEVDAR